LLVTESGKLAALTAPETVTIGLALTPGLENGFEKNLGF